MSDRGFDISILGDKELVKRLRKLEFKTERKYVKKAMRESMRNVLRRSKAMAPVRTGALRKGIKLRAGKTRYGVHRMVVRTGTRKEMGLPEYDPDGSAAARFYYPAHIELGTGKTRAIPFLRKPLESSRAVVVATFKRVLWEQTRGHLKG